MLETKPVQIILPIHNRWEHTKQTLDSLIKFTPWELFDLFVIDDGSDHDCYQKIVDYRLHVKESLGFNFELFRNHEAIGPGAARNMVIGKIEKYYVHSPFLYFTDNDVYFQRGWLSKMIQAYNRAAGKGLRLLGGSCHPYLQNNEVWDFEDFHIGIKDAVSGYSHFMSWETFKKYGPFDEGSRGLEEKTGRSEDWALCRKIVEAGFFVGSVEPELLIACGKTNTYGKPAVGQETFHEVQGVMIA